MTKRNRPRLIALLAAGQDVRTAAAQAGYSETTVHKYLKQTDFMGQVDSLRRQMIDQSVGRLTEGTAKAVETLIELLESTSDRTRLGAAKALLDAVLKLRESVEIENRIAQLEMEVNETFRLTNSSHTCSPSINR